MFDILINVWTSMHSFEFFYYVPCMALVCGLVGLFKVFCIGRLRV